MFTPNNLLKEYLNAKPRDMYDIVGALIGYINADPKFETDDFENAIKYVISQGVLKENLFDSFDDKIEYEVDESKWNENYYSLARVYLKDNFCEKRIEHVKAIAKKLYLSVTRMQNGTKTQNHGNIAVKTSGGNSSKKQQSQQPISKQKSKMPTIAKVAIIVGVLVLLALIVKQTMN